MRGVPFSRYTLLVTTHNRSTELCIDTIHVPWLCQLTDSQFSSGSDAQPCARLKPGCTIMGMGMGKLKSSEA